MSRLRGLDEMPERTGLEIDWNAILPNEDGGAGRLASCPWTRIASIGLAIVMVALGVYALGAMMLPTRAQIESEEQRRQIALVNARDNGDRLASAIRPGIAGIDGTVTHDQASAGDGSGPIFPEGTIEWGEEGQPIGGDLERIEIWDVTRSPQDKVVRVRSGPDTVFATIYLGSGKRTAIMVPAGRAYQVMATSGDEWQGPDALFGPTATTVNFGIATIHSGSPGVVAMGASDQPASVVANGRF